MLKIVIFVVLVVFGEKTFGNDDNYYRLFPPLPVDVIKTKNIICQEHTKLYVEHLKNLSTWAHEMQDSSAPYPIGILRGSFSQFGQFQECLSAKAPFPKQYCLAAITAHVPHPNPSRNPKSLDYEPNESVLRKIYDKKDPSQQPENTALLAWCVPASCTPKDLEEHLNDYLKNVDFNLREHNVTYTANVAENSCQRENENQYFDYVDITFCLTVGIVVVLLVFSTCFTLFYQHEEKPSEKSPLYRLALSFSICDNFKRLATQDNSSDPALKVLYGVRVLAILVVIMDHRFGTHLSSGILNFNTVEEQYRSALGTLFFHGDLFVDSFFILSGLLVTYCLLVQFDKKMINPLFIILMRYIRLTPIYAFVIFYYATLFYHIGDGPMWKIIIGPEIEDCRQNWWANLLYINNYVNADHMCMVHSWYLPCDFHYFIIALLICVAIHKNRKVGLILLGVTTLVSILVPILIVIVNARPAVLFFYPEFLRAPKSHVDFLLTYSKSHTRASPYFVGMLAGYFYYKRKGCERHLQKSYSYLITLACLGIMIMSILTGAIFYDENYKYNAFESGMYSALHRTIWAVGSIGILYVASYGYSKFIYNVLSWSPWVPLSKLVYGAYLVHMQFQMRAVARKGGANFASYFDVISLSLSDMVLAFGTAFVLYLAIEAPIRNIFSVLLASPVKKKEETQSEEENKYTCSSHL